MGMENRWGTGLLYGRFLRARWMTPRAPCSSHHLQTPRPGFVFLLNHRIPEGLVFYTRL